MRGLDKIVYLLNGLPKDNLLHHEELSEMLFTVNVYSFCSRQAEKFQFGRTLQYLFSQSPCHHLAATTQPFAATDFDANDFLPSFMQFCMYKPPMLEALSSPNVVNKTLVGYRISSYQT